MAAAEAEASSAGEPILHVHDQVRLEGLVKNKGTNGALGILQAYGAESHRWKVTLHDGQVFWIKPKLLKPLQLRRMPLPDPSPPEDTTHADEVQCTGFMKFDMDQAHMGVAPMAWSQCQAMLGFLQSIGAFDALPTIDNSPQRTPGTLQVALPFCGSMQELLVITDFLAKQVLGQQNVKQIAIMGSDLFDWNLKGGYWRQKELHVRRQLPGMDLKFCQLDLSAVQHPPASLVFAIHPECTVQRELWKKILSNVISATVGLCVVATFSEDEAKVVASIGQALQRRCQVHQNPYYEGASPPSGPSGPPSGPGGCYPNPPFMKYIVTVTR
ncbi:Uncharacterized protein SCF082_LOCUS51101 [Durusdinium trenchii]|uniref:Uncharacterized protein n=2 Tax=Durusdinium trenchii TaxID=1381693 RepID=A0ABP0SC77_9DINO